MVSQLVQAVSTLDRPSAPACSNQAEPVGQHVVHLAAIDALVHPGF
jgi:hypothetical protein